MHSICEFAALSLHTFVPTPSPKRCDLVVFLVRCRLKTQTFSPSLSAPFFRFTDTSTNKVRCAKLDFGRYTFIMCVSQTQRSPHFPRTINNDQSFYPLQFLVEGRTTGKQQLRDELLCHAQQNYFQQTRKNGGKVIGGIRTIWNTRVPVNFPQGFARDRLKPVWSDLHPRSFLTRPVLMSRAPSCPAWTRSLSLAPSLIPPNPPQSVWFTERNNNLEVICPKT